MLAARHEGSQWLELPPDLLRDISGRLHAAADFVRFHAVCRPWHDSLDDDWPRRFQPWLLAPSDADVAANNLADQRCRCVFSKTGCRAPGVCVRDRRVACADGTAAWLVSRNHESQLVNPLTAALLPFPRAHMLDKCPDHPHRIVSGDGTVLVYDFITPCPATAYYPYESFRGAFLRGGGGGECPYGDDERWVKLSKDLSTDRCCAAAYLNGDIVFVDLANCYVLRPTRPSVFKDFYMTRGTMAALPDEPAGKVRQWSYLLESGGELLLASVLQEACTDGPLAGHLSVSLHALDLKADDDGGEEPVVEWARRDGGAMTALDDRALFLGFPGSFALEAAQFGWEVSGGTAYFVVDDSAGHGSPSSSAVPPPQPCSVYRYSFRDGAATLVEALPRGWHDARCMWFIPQPKVARIRARRTEKEAPATCGSSARRQELRIYAGDLSPKVDNSRLRQMFSKHGKVAHARVAYDRSGRSRGFVTMATHEGFDSVMAALNAVEETHGTA